MVVEWSHLVAAITGWAFALLVHRLSLCLASWVFGSTAAEFAVVVKILDLASMLSDDAKRGVAMAIEERANNDE